MHILKGPDAPAVRMFTLPSQRLIVRERPPNYSTSAFHFIDMAFSSYICFRLNLCNCIYKENCKLCEPLHEGWVCYDTSLKIQFRFLKIKVTHVITDTSIFGQMQNF